MNNMYQIRNQIKELLNHQDRVLTDKFVKELNQFRKQPNVMIQYLNQRKQNYSLDTQNHLLFSPNYPSKALQTTQGKHPIPQLLSTLLSLPPLPPLTPNPMLSLLAQHLASTFTNIYHLSQIKLTQSHSKSLRMELNNSTEYNFIDRIMCLIGVGFDEDKYQPLISLLVDDGCKDRRNREILMSKEMRFVGVGTTRLNHKDELRVVVYMLTGNIINK